MSSLFHRGAGLPTATRAGGVWIEDTDGNRYLDAAGGALVVGVGHGDAEIIAAIHDQAQRLSYVHASAFTSQVTEAYAEELARLLPLRDARIYPVSGGSEAVETALKMARAFHLANGEPERTEVIAREISYHGNTRGALDVSGRNSLREPYLPWLGLTRRVPGVLEYRCPNPDHPDRCAAWHAGRLEAAIEKAGAGRVAAFVAEPIGGAASGAAVPPDGYWPAVAEVCARHGVLLVADEVMSGFARTGKWFASEHFGLEPDILVAAKGASSGYWPLGLCAVSGPVYETITSGGGLVHGFTFSHHAVGAAVGAAVLRRIVELDLIRAAVRQGQRLISGLEAALAEHPLVGDIRGRGLLVAIELVEDRESKRPFDRRDRLAESVAAGARDLGLLVYPSSGCADGVNGDMLLFGPPLIITDDEVDLVIARTAEVLSIFA